DLVAGALVVVREPALVRAGEERTAGDPHHAAGAGRAARPRAGPGWRVHPGLGERERLQHRLVVLVLVLDHHVPDHVTGAALEHPKNALAHRAHVLTGAREVEVGHVAA